ncbi:integrase family protein [Thalassoporum mexicanum PCC 7367]|uniref:site-specific integrase n=1 Tax=Thalassoporum mexicanum TaxID=3457544 RepID=UPI00029FD901|nr:site-specific integrase [Pseudanabaena sp. PCC 7367]AFY71439.1 integrase family protein [Pseudanabaena sp. PCC 7367]
MKNKRGTVSILNQDDRIRLRWSYQGKRYNLGLGLAHNKQNMLLAKQTAIAIEQDMLTDNFDYILDRYKLSPPNDPKSGSNQLEAQDQLNILEIWDRWVDSLSLPERTRANHYQLVRKMLERHVPTIKNASKWYEQHNHLADLTYNQRLTYLNSCFEWAVFEGLTTTNPFRRVKRRKVAKSVLRPFSTAEVALIIEAFKSNKYCPPNSRYLHSHYADYVEFLLLTGCRPSEAIGLQRKHINLDRNEIVVCSVLARGDHGGSSSARRVRKETKTGSIRYLTMTNRLRQIIEARCHGLSAEELVFTSPTGLAIDDRNFLRRQWKTVLNGLGIEYRKPYTTRHTMASMAIEQGIPLTGVAYLLGHSDTKMVIETYGHMINRPSLPEIDI